MAGPRAAGGIVLLELVLALAILGLIAALALPHVPRSTGPAALRAEAYRVAALLRQDRDAAIRRRADVVARLDLAARTVVAGADGRVVRLPRDIRIDLVQSDREATASGGGIRFYPDGRSSGGVVTLSRGALAWRVQVNWLTAAVTVAHLADDHASAR